MAESKNALEIGRDEKFLHKRAAGRSVFDTVAYNGTAAVLDKGMFVHPERVGSFGLTVDETLRRFPDGNFTLPAQRDAAQPQAVIEQGSLLDDNVRRRDDLKVQPRRREALQVARIGEKLEYLGARRRNQQLGFNLVSLHRSFLLA